MLLQFSVKNYKTFKDKATLSLIASNYDKGTREEDNIFINEKYGLRILKSAVVYGANASGKSKLIDAFSSMRYFVYKNFTEDLTQDRVNIQPFRLNEETANAPSEFEIIFLLNGVMHRYGFEITPEKVVSEWLYCKPKTKEIELFFRGNSKYNTHKKLFTKGGVVAEQGFVRGNALLLSVAAQFNETIAINIINWFQKEVQVLSCLEEQGYRWLILEKAKDPAYRTKIMELMKAADLGIQDISLQKINITPKDAENKEVHDKKMVLPVVLTLHKQYNSYKEMVGGVVFSLNTEESAGTEKFFYLTAPILDILENGNTLIVDELGSSLHPKLIERIVSLFNSKEINPKNAQLIFTTHDTNLLSTDLFRRDQVWFTEKNRYGEAKLYSLADFKSSKVRKGESYEDNYIKGKYGAVPFLADFDKLKNSSHYGKKK